MARKTTPRSKSKTPGRTATARGAAASTAEPPKKKAGFGKRSIATSAAASAARSKSSEPKAARSSAAKATKPSPAKAAKPARKSLIGKAVGAVTSTVAGVADTAASVFKRDRGATKSR